MSNAVFPTLPGLAWDVHKKPAFITKTQVSVGNVEQRASFTPFPRWTWTLKYNVLRQGAPYAEFEALANFFLARQGAFDSFLFDDPSDDAVTDQLIGTGDGATTVFQLFRGFVAGGFLEPVYNPNVISTIKVNGVAASYTYLGGDQVQMTAPPAIGAAVTWTGSYRWRVRFTDDLADFNNFASAFWELQQLSFISILGS